MEVNPQIKQEDTEGTFIKQEEKESTLNNDNEIFIMNYEDDYLFESEAGFPECIKKEEQSTVEIKVFSKLEEEDQGLCDVDIKDEVLDTFHKETDVHSNDNTEGPKKTVKDKSDSYLDKKQKRRIRHPFDPDRKLSCAKCEFKAVKKHHLASHIKQAHPKNQQPKQTLIECDYCMFSTTYKTSFQMHMTRFHLDEIEQKDKKTVEKKKSCFDTKGIQLDDHITAGKDKIYSCKYCSFTSPKRIVMRHHVAPHVLYKKPVEQCPHCPLKYTTEAMYRHMQAVHNPEGLFKCPKCYYVTKFKPNLRRHMKQNKDLDECLPIKRRKASVFKDKPEKPKKKLDC